MAKSEVLNGDQIAAQIKSHGTDSNYAEIAREIHDMMDHTRPGASVTEMAKINDAFHAKGVLPGVQITGVQGEDLIGTNLNDRGEGNAVRVDSTNVGLSKWDALAPTKTQVNGREASIAADGSGYVTVKPGDNPSFIARDMLKSQGNPNPTDREIAMYELKLEQLNGAKIAHHLRSGQKLLLPPALKDTVDGVDGGNSSFLPERTKDAYDTKTAQIQSDNDAAWDALKKGGDWGHNFSGGIGGFSIAMSDIDKNLAPGSQITDKERQGFQFLKDNWNTLSRDGRVWENELRGWTVTANRDAAHEYELHKEG